MRHADDLDESEVLATVAWFHWLRYGVSAGEDHDREFRIAIGLFARLLEIDPTAVPDHVREALTGSPAPTSPSPRDVRADESGERRERLEESFKLATESRLEDDAVAALADVRELAGAVTTPGDDDHVFALACRAELLTLLTDCGRVGVDEAVEAHEELLDYLDEDHSHHPFVEAALGDLLLKRAEMFGSAPLRDLSDDGARAADLFDSAAARAPLDDPRRPQLVRRQLRCARRRAELAEDQGDLGMAATLLERVMHDGDADGDRRPLAGWSDDLEAEYGRVLLAHGTITGTAHELEQAAALFDRAAVGFGDRSAMLARLHADTAIAQLALFQLTGALDVLDASIECGRRALDLTEPEAPLAVSVSLNLGLAHFARGQAVGRIADIDLAIEVLEQLCRSSGPVEPAAQASILLNLSSALMVRGATSRARADLVQAETAARRGLELLTSDAGARHAHVMMVARIEGALARWDPEHVDPRALARVVESLEPVVADCNDRRILTLAHSEIMTSLKTLAAITDDPADLDRAVDAGRRAIAALGTGHVNAPVVQLLLAEALAQRAEAGHGERRVEDLDDAISGLRAVAASPSATPSSRYSCARRWAELASERGELASAVEGYRLAVEVAHIIVTPWLAEDDEERRLKSLVDLGSDAAATCLQAGLPALAVELFEAGRAIVFSKELALRSELDRLDDRRPDLASRLRDTLAFMSAEPGHDIASSRSRIGASGGFADARMRAPGAWERLVAEIRAVPGFERFLTPAVLDELLPTTPAGAIVVVNVNERRSDALVLTSSGVDVIPLRLRPDDVREQVGLFLGAMEEPEPEDLPGVRRILRQAWDTVAAPVLEHLGIDGPPASGEEWPRVWWCLSGVLTFFPMHAAGIHGSDGEGRAVLDRAVSSTVPTVGAATADAVADDPAGKDQILAIVMPETPGEDDLPGALEETRQLELLVTTPVRVLGGGRIPAVRSSVLAALARARWVHFGCHAMGDPTDPRGRSLLLEDHRERPLTIRDISAQRSSTAELAFLSACTTGRSSARTPDEPISLVSACRLAGFRHVVGTLWPIDDRAAVRVSGRFYEALVSAAGSELAADAAAAALHDAVRQLRAAHPDRVYDWAAWVHSGP